MWYRTAKINYEDLIKSRKLVSTCIIFRKTKNGIEVLLERRGSSPNEHKWCIPGGHVEKDEDPIDAAIREIKEETNLTINKPDLILVGHHDNEDGRDKYNFIFATEYTGNSEAKASSDAEFVEWYGVDKMPKLIWDNDKFIQKAKKMLKI